MRYELKYMLTPLQYTLLQGRLKWVMEPDEHAGATGEYFIRSIYFDSPDRMALREKRNGLDQRKKYRIRFYNGDFEHCLLECKEKTGTRIQKISERLTLEQVQNLLSTCGGIPEGDFRKNKEDGQLQDNLRERLQILKAVKGFQPIVTVDYVREAYVFPVSDLRITFDKEIAWGTVDDCLGKDRFLSNIYGEGIVLEVKYNEYLPEHVSRILSSVSPVQTAVSKYVACVEAQYEALGY